MGHIAFNFLKMFEHFFLVLFLFLMGGQVGVDGWWMAGKREIARGEGG